jgi:ribonucleoside-diphosphate reductase alpha chain
MRTIRKRDGSMVRFEPRRISSAICKAFSAQGIEDIKISDELARTVVETANKRFGDGVPSTEDIQNIVEEVLISEGYADVAKAYTLHRKRHSNLMEAEQLLGVHDDLKLSLNAIEVLKRRYLARDEKGCLAETPGEMFARVARHISLAEKNFGGNAPDWANRFGKVMREMLFLPNSPTLMNAGLPLGQLSACFVLPIEDSLVGIFDALKYMALIHQSGGGTGFSFSRLRPKNDIVRATGGVASGPISFMQIFDAATNVIKQGGRRRGANMGVLRVDHPDILEFVAAKERPGFLENFNLSVAATDRFMSLARSGGNLNLINPRNGEAVGSQNASEILDLIATTAWRSGEPGVIFIDRINSADPVPGTIEATNPCGEQPLLPYESCNLGSINLSRLVRQGEADWDGLFDLARLGIRFLDDALEVNKFPLKQIEEATLKSRKVGLGVMGFAEMLIQMNIAYGSDDAVKVAEETMGFLTSTAREASEELGMERGSFTLFEESTLKSWGAMRNATVTTIAPTGTISIIAGTSSGIEPLFALSFVRQVMEGARLQEVSPLFEKMARERGIYNQALRAEVAKTGSIQEMAGVSEDLKDLFVTALDISPDWHVRVQAAFQKHTDNAVSKTVNLPSNASVSDVLNVYNLAYDLGCKGVTVYRYGCRNQVLYVGEKEAQMGCRSCG